MKGCMLKVEDFMLTFLIEQSSFVFRSKKTKV